MQKIKYLGNYKNGKFELGSSTELKTQLSPADLKDEVIDMPTTFDSASEMCEIGKKAHYEWARLSLEKRKTLLLKLTDVFESKIKDLATVIARETGKPLKESEGEVRGLINKINVTCNKSILRIEEQMVSNKNGLVAKLKSKSRGLFVVIGPFNFPMHLGFSQILPALLAGNTVIFKPSPKTPASGQSLAQCFDEIGLPKGVFQMAQGDVKTSQDLISHNLVDGICFVGSFQVGMQIKQSLVNDYKKILALEMGGYNTTLIWDYKNLEQVVSETLKSCFFTAGQRCSSTSQILINKKIAKDFLPSFLKQVEDLKIGHWKEDVYMGSLIDQASVDRCFNFQEELKAKGVKILKPAKDLSHLGGYYVSPGIYQVDKAQAFKVGHEEIFTPQVIVYEVEDLKEAAKMINHSGYGLVLSVFTNDDKVKQEMFYGAQVGLLNINRASCGASGDLPFGGLGKSGNDRPAGNFAIDFCTSPLAQLETEA